MIVSMPIYMCYNVIVKEIDKLPMVAEGEMVYCKKQESGYIMIYEFLILNDNTKIVYSEVIEKNGREQVEVRIEREGDEKIGSASCWLPDYRWENMIGFSEVEIKYFQEYLISIAHIIMQLAREGGFESGMDSASNKC